MSIIFMLICCFLGVNAAYILIGVIFGIKYKKRIAAKLFAFPGLCLFAFGAAVILNAGILYLSAGILLAAGTAYNTAVFYRLLQDIIENASKDSEQMKDMKASLMLSQIKPHFLYNTLNTIQYLCRTEPEQAAETISDFSEYLRMNLSVSNEKQIIPFSQELEHVKRYIKIEKLRFKHRLRVQYEIEKEDFYVPVLSVQPLVENAVKHGISGRMNGGTVTISSFSRDNKIIIEVKDDGVGFDKNKADMKQDSLGMKNVELRVKSLFDGEMQIESIENMGTTVRLVFPEKIKG